ncbi:hypothetical protein [Bifidobacterium sp.]|uniref:hypothetical protein n=1 Tax=Bifidobacterium sp. TaxID=41200 RepID=UPI0025C0DB58|nr:hypothetical protein [Bifidobacterium sp.]
MLRTTRPSLGGTPAESVSAHGSRPDYRIGISRRQWKLIDTFVRHSEQFDAVTFDMEPTCRIYDIHHGF